jgi:hypothetical protein
VAYIFVAPVIGTNTWVHDEPLPEEEWYWLDDGLYSDNPTEPWPGAILVETTSYFDEKRPDVPEGSIFGHVIYADVTYNAVEYFVCLGFDMVAAPSGTMDIGDPYAYSGTYGHPVKGTVPRLWLDTAPTGPQKNVIANYLGISVSVINDMSWRQIGQEVIGGRPGWGGVF